MEEVLFRNEFVRDRACAKEIFTYYVFGRTIIKLMYGFYAFCFVITMICGFILGDFGGALFIVLAVALLALTMLLNYRVQVKTLVARDAEVSGGEPMLVTTELSDAGLTVRACGNETTMPLDVIKSAYRTKNYIVIITKAKFMYILKNDAYSVGDADGLWALLKRKRIKFI